MSNSTRPGGYDERLVVPLEASRRGAHRARVNPFVGALPLLAVVMVVALVIGVAYTLFMRNSSTEDASPTTPTNSAPTNPSPAPTATAPAGGSSSTKPASSPSASATTTAKVDRAAAFTVYNGSTARVSKLASKANTALQSAGFTNGQVNAAPTPPVSRSQTTRIYYATSADKATAEAIKTALGVGTTKLSPTVAAQGIVVVVGDDYAG
jgi:hypothetical protein